MSSTAVLASRWARLAAAIINGVLFYGILFVFGFIQLQAKIMSGQLDQDPSAALMPFMMMLIAALIFLGVQWYLLTTLGQSLGKIILGIRIAHQKTGESRGFVQNVLLRSILNTFLGFIPLYGFVDALFIFRADKRCIHDLIAGTVVVKK